MTAVLADERLAPVGGLALVGVAGVRVPLDDERLDGRRHQQVVVADAVGVHLAVAAEHDDRHAAGLDLVHQPPGEVLRQRREA